MMLTNEEKVEKRKKGVLVGFDWIKKGPNEPLDCRCYAMGAFESLNVHLGKMKLRLDRMAARRREKMGGVDGLYGQVRTGEDGSADRREGGLLRDARNDGEEVIETKHQQRKRKRKTRGFVNAWR